MAPTRRAKHLYEAESLDARAEGLAAARRKEFKGQRIVEHAAMSVKSTRRALLSNKCANS